jgi:hypothetical protein
MASEVNTTPTVSTPDIDTEETIETTATTQEPVSGTVSTVGNLSETPVSISNMLAWCENNSSSQATVWYDTKTDGEFYKATDAPSSATVGKYDGYFYATRVYNAVYNDYAELMKSDIRIEPGYVAYADDKGILHNTGDPCTAVGVVTDRWGYLLGGENAHDQDGYSAISLSGRVPVIVESDADIQIGDMIAATSEGYGRKATRDDFGCIIGKCVGPDPDGRKNYINMLVGMG